MQDSELFAKAVSFAINFISVCFEQKDVKATMEMLNRDAVWTMDSVRYSTNDIPNIISKQEKSPSEIAVENISCSQGDSNAYVSAIVRQCYQTSLSPRRMSVNLTLAAATKSSFSLVRVEILSALNSFSSEEAISCATFRIGLNERRHQEEFELSQKRYATAIRLSGLTVFEYDIRTKQLVFFDDVTQIYNLPNIVENGVETLILRGVIEPESVGMYKEMYDKIDMGEPQSKCLVQTRDRGGALRDLELSLTSICDGNDIPVRAIGIRRNISQQLALEKEQKYAKGLAMDKTLMLEADVSNNRVIALMEEWAELAGNSADRSYSEIVRSTVALLVAPEHQQRMIDWFSVERIKEEYDKRNTIPTIIYKRLFEDAYMWHEATINIIQDEHTGHLNIRVYRQNINERRQKEQRALEEKRLYESITAKAKLAYEANITKNSVVSGHEHWGERYGIEISHSYDEMIESFAKVLPFKEDAECFVESFSSENVLRRFEQGHRTVSCQYRRPPEGAKESRWFCCNFHVFEDPESGDIKCFAYVEDINEKKQNELALKHSAEHDSLTNLLNKATTQTVVDTFLSSEEGLGFPHAFLMVDIDYFKLVNDTMGHIYGDLVLEDIARILMSVFRENDIVGRIGGDEFCVFMKNASNRSAIESKASDVCTRLRRTFKTHGVRFTISASIGISICEEKSNTYQDLYARADRALYIAKGNGRDQYAFG